MQARYLKVHHPSTRFCPVLVHTQKVLGPASTSILAERRKKEREVGWMDGGKEGRREGGRRDGKKEGRPTVHRMILVIHDEVRIKKQINSMKIEWRWCLAIGDGSGKGGGSKQRRQGTSFISQVSISRHSRSQNH